MAICIGITQVPKKGDVVKSVKFDKRKEVVWVAFESGKRLISHIYK